MKASFVASQKKTSSVGLRLDGGGARTKGALRNSGMLAAAALKKTNWVWNYFTKLIDILEDIVGSEDIAVTKYRYLCCCYCTVQTTEITGEEHPGKPQLSDWNSSLSILLYVANTYQNFSAGMAKNISATEKNCFNLAR